MFEKIKNIIKKQKINKGFTLVEMVCTMSIVACLTTIVSPMVLTYVDKANGQNKKALVKSVWNATVAENTAKYTQGKSFVSSANKTSLSIKAAGAEFPDYLFTYLQASELENSNISTIDGFFYNKDPEMVIVKFADNSVYYYPDSTGIDADAKDGTEIEKELDAATSDYIEEDDELKMLYSLTDAGLYETGTNHMIKDWDTLVEEGLVTVNGSVYEGTRASSDFAGDLVLPSSIKELKNYAFSNSYLTGLKIPDSVSVIGQYMCNYCTKLENVILPKTVKEISTRYMFYYCDKLKSVSLPQGTTSVGYGCFWNCYNCDKFSLPEGIEIIDDYSFRCYSKYENSIEEIAAKPCIIKLPSTVRSIGNYAFNGRGLTNIVIPSGIESLGNYCFSHNFFETLVIPNKNTVVLNNCAIEYCPQLKRIVVCGDFEFGQYFSGFNYLPNLEYIEFQGNVGDIPANGLKIYNSGSTQLKDLSGNVIKGYDGSKLKSIIFKKDVGNIGNNAFATSFYSEEKLVSNLEKIEFQGNVTSMKSIGYSAFYYLKNLKTVEIPDSVTKMDGTVFYKSGIESVTLPKNAVNVADDCFSFSSLKTVQVPKEFTSTNTISSGSKGYVSFGGAFINCPDLEAINVEEGNTQFTSQNGVLYNKDKTRLLKVPAKNSLAIGNVVVPPSVTTLGTYAYSNSMDLTDIDIANTSTIEEDCFIGCANLANISSGIMGTTSIPDFMYAGTGITSITIPDGVTSIGYQAFANCQNLESVYIPDSVTEIGSGAFYNCPKLSTVRYSQNMAYVPDTCFLNDILLQSIELPNGITELREDCLSGTGLTTITIPASVTSIKTNALRGCRSLQDVVYNGAPNSIVFGTGVFYYDTALTNTNSIEMIKNGTIPAEMFSNCTAITSCTIPNNITTLGNGCFMRCNNLKQVTIGSGIKAISQKAFYASGLTSVSIPNTVTSIGVSAFESCNSLRTVTMANSVKTIGTNAFAYDSALTSVSLSSAITNIPQMAFSYCTSLTITVPSTVTYVYASKYSYGGWDSESAFYNVRHVYYSSGIATGGPWGAYAYN